MEETSVNKYKKKKKHVYIYSRKNMATTKYLIILFHRGLPSTSSWYKVTIKKNPASTIFYQYKDLHPGKKMTFLFTNSGTKVSFLPRQVAESIPFSSDKNTRDFEVVPLEVTSKEAQVIRDEIGGAEHGMRRQILCKISWVIDWFSVESLGHNDRVLSTEPSKKQEYTISEKKGKWLENIKQLCFIRWDTHTQCTNAIYSKQKDPWRPH